MVTPADAERLRWPAAVAALTAASVSHALFAATWLLGGWPAWLLAPILLWCANVLVLVGARISLSGKGYYTRESRYAGARSFAFMAALGVGLWLGYWRSGWPALATLPGFAMTVNYVARSTGQSDTFHVRVPALPWVGCVVSGELLGYLAAAAVHALGH